MDQHAVMTAIHNGVPITLICDLADPAGPRSAEILAWELAALGRCIHGRLN